MTKKTFNPPVKRIAKQIVTSPFGYRIMNEKEQFHYGVDLRTIRFPKEVGEVPVWALQKIQTTEPCRVLRSGTDDKKNDFIVVSPLVNVGYPEIGYVHVALNEDFFPGQILDSGHFLGYSQIKGSSKAHHLHFFVKSYEGFTDPLIYLTMIGIDYKFK